MGPRHCVCTAERWTRDRTLEANGGMGAAPRMCVCLMVGGVRNKLRVWNWSWWCSLIFQYSVDVNFCWQCRCFMASLLLVDWWHNLDIDTKLLTPWRYVNLLESPGDPRCVPLLKNPTIFGYLPPGNMQKNMELKAWLQIGTLWEVSSWCVCVYIDDMTWWNSSVMMGFWGYKRHKKGMICVSQVKRFSTSCVQGPNGWLAGFVFMLGEGGGGDPSNLVETCNRCPFHIDVLLVSMVFLGGTSKIRSWFRFLHDVI